jgi:hypothetical protein
VSAVERRTSKRIPIIVKAVVTIESHEYEAELRDICREGMGLVLTNSLAGVKENVNTTIRFNEGTIAAPAVSGRLRLGPSYDSYRPNYRSCGVCVDPELRDSLHALIDQYDGPPCSINELGFLRARNMFDSTERSLLDRFFEHGGVNDPDAAQIADNLIHDSNCSAARLLHLMKLLIEEIRRDHVADAMTVLRKAFENYQIHHALTDLKKDRLINYGLGSSRLASV